MSDLSRPNHMDRIREFQKTSSDPKALKALEVLVTQNLGFQLFQTIEQTKRALSSSIVAKLDFDHGPIKIHEVITRDRFEKMIEKELAAVEEGVHLVVEEAGLSPDDIEVVLRTGGSSAVPAFVDMLAGIFSEDRLMELEPLVSVVGGMAVIAQENQAAHSPLQHPLRNARQPAVYGRDRRDRRSLRALLRAGGRERLYRRLVRPQPHPGGTEWDAEYPAEYRRCRKRL